MASRAGPRIVRSDSAPLTRTGAPLCDSLASRLKTLNTILAPVAYAKGAVLFMEGEPSCGIFVVSTGQVKLSTSSLDGKTIILKIAEVGELLGLPATLSGKPYEASAEVSDQACVSFIPRATFLRFLRANPDAVMQVAQLLSENHFAGHEVIRSLGLSRPASEKLARFLLSWSADHAHGRDYLRIALTHQEIGQMIGVSRETVTRLLTVFRKKNFLTIKGATVNIYNRVALQNLARP